MRTLPPAVAVDGLRPLVAPYAAPFADATWHAADETGAGLETRFPAGTLAGVAYLAFDLLVEG